MTVDLWSSQDGCQPQANQVSKFIQELIPNAQERRQEERIPFSNPVTIYFDDSAIPVAGVIRDISETGVGIILDVPLQLGEATLRITVGESKTMCARVKLLWCDEVARHGYLSGGIFVRVFEEDPVQLTD